MFKNMARIFRKISKKYLHNFCQVVKMQYSYSFADTSSPQIATFNCFFFFFPEIPALDLASQIVL